MSTTELKLNGTTVLSENNSTINLVTTTANIGTNALVVSSDGKVGIGTSSPASKLYVSHTTSDVSAAAASRNPIASFSGGNANNRLDVYVDNSGGTAHMGLGAYNLAGGATELGFYTGGSVTERMRINSNGNVGIGTSSPNYKLENKDDDIAVVKLTSAAGGNAVNGIRFRVNNSADTAQSATLGMVNAETASGWGGSLTFSTKAANGQPNESVTERMRLTSNGGLAIGITTSGSYALIVSRSENQPIVEFANSATSTSGPGCIQTSLNGTNQNNDDCHHLKATTQTVNSWYLYGNGTSSFSSDEKLKKNIETTRDGYIEDIKNLRIVKYHWKDQDETTPKELGLIAQEVEQVFPGLIQEHELEGVKQLYLETKDPMLPHVIEYLERRLDGKIQ